MPAIAAPLSAEKVEAWRAWVDDLNGARKSAFDDMNARHGLTEHRAYLQPLPDGNYLVLAVHEGPGAAAFLANAVASDHEFDRWFTGQVAGLHGIDTAAPLPPPAERCL